MRRIPPLIATVAVAVSLAGCSGTKSVADPTVPAPSVPSSVPSSSVTTTTPPVMPTTTMAHTRAGAIAFVRYYWQVASYAEASLDSADVRRLSRPVCKACIDVADSIDTAAAADAKITGGQFTVLNVRVTSAKALGKDWIIARFRIHSEPERISYPTKKDDTYPGGVDVGQMVLEPVDAGWLVNDLEM